MTKRRLIRSDGMTDNPHTINISLPRLTSKLDFLRDTLVDFLNTHNIQESAVSRIELSVYEAVVNIIEHCPPEFNEKDIHIVCRVQDNEVSILISHYGDEFDITKAKLPDIEKHYKSGKMRGLGIYFIMTLMDVVEYSYGDMMNTLKMIKKL
jgi:anti-sigma regulatory factor (Ser/Thr protein kinase)